jgi:hypothetical protein
MISDFLKSPTDNLYKFMTLSGLVLLLISVTYLPWLLHKAVLATYDARKDYEILEMEIAEEKKKYEALDRELDRQISERPIIENNMTAMQTLTEKKQLSPSELSVIRSQLSDVKALLDENEKRQSQLTEAASVASQSVKRKGIELDYKLRIAEWETRNGRILTVLSLLGSVIGGLIAVKGFNAWSLRVQVYQDAILKKQAEESAK